MATEYWLAPVNVYIGATQIVTEGGATVAINTDMAEVKDDTHGTVPIDIVVTGQGGTITINVADTQMATLASIFPAATLIGSGATGRLEFRTSVGTSLLDSAVALQLRKVVNGIDSTDKSKWITAPKAVPSGKVSFAVTKDKQTVFPVEFRCLPDTGNNNRCIYFGDALAS